MFSKGILEEKGLQENYDRTLEPKEWNHIEKVRCQGNCQVKALQISRFSKKEEKWTYSKTFIFLEYKM